MSKSDRFIHDPLHGRILYNELEEQILSSKLFNRLHHITQNSTTFFTFPAAKHSRHLHSIGTMHIASQMLRYALINAEDQVLHEFLDSFKLEMESVLKQLVKNLQTNDHTHALSPDHQRMLMHHSPHYQNIAILEIEKNRLNYFDINLPEHLISPYYFLLQILRLAALLHDVGHPPFSHLVEWSLEYTFSSLIDKENKTSKELHFCDLYQSLGMPMKEKNFHEQLGDDIAKNILLHEILSTSYSSLEHNLTVWLVHAMLQKVFANEVSPLFNYEYLHKLVDGMIDADRLDYVLRDTLFSGYNAASFDLNRIIQSFILIKKENYSFYFYPSIKAVSDVEKFLTARFNLYTDVLFHHKVQKTNTILHHTLVEIALDYLSSEVPENTEEETFRLPANISGLWKVLNGGSSLIKDRLFSQYDENWLLTILKDKYFLLDKELSEPENTMPIKYEKIYLGLEEVLFGRNKFISGWKRKNQFCDFFNLHSFNYEDIISVFEMYYKEIQTLLKKFVRDHQRKDFFLYFAQNQFKNGYHSTFKFHHNGTLIEIGQVSNIERVLKLTASSNVPFFFYSTRPFEKEPEAMRTLIALISDFITTKIALGDKNVPNL